MLMQNGENCKLFLRSRKSKHASPFSVLSFSAHSFQTLGIFLQFHRTFSKFQGKKSEKCPTKLHKQHVTFSKRHVVSSKTSTSFEKKTTHKPVKPPKIAIFEAAENRIILNNFPSVPNTALNGGAQNANFY